MDLREARIAVRALPYVGVRYRDPICGGGFRKLATWAPGEPAVVCPRCFSAPRTRLLWLYLQREVGLDQRLRVLHFAPERGLRRRLEANPLIDYTSVDIEPGRADVTADITALPFADKSFDVVLCSHVLEHVPDDGAGMRELARVADMAILQHPIDEERAVTYEDPTVTTPEGREEVFFQFDHVRIYGRDFTDRLEAAGFDVEVVRYREQLSLGERERYCLDIPTDGRGFEGDVIYVARS